jgi:hypothetical protein
MKISNFPRINRGDFSGAPDWFNQFVERLNPILEEVIDCLQGNVHLPHNMNGVYRTVEVKDDTEYEIQTGIRGSVIEVSIAYSAYYEYPRLIWKRAVEDKIRFKVKFDVAPSSAVEVTLRILGAGE